MSDTDLDTAFTAFELLKAMQVPTYALSDGATQEWWAPRPAPQTVRLFRR